MFTQNKKIKIVKLKLVKDVAHVSLLRAAIFVIIFASLGAYLLYVAFASTSVIASVEAEQLQLPAGASVINDSAASSGKAARFGADGGVLSGQVNLPAQASSVTVIARANKCKGVWPSMTLSVGNKVVLGPSRVSSSSWRDFTASTVVPSGTAPLTVKYSANKSGCNSNLYVDVVRLDGAPLPTPAPTLALSASPTNLNAGDSSALTWNTTNATSCTASGGWSGSQSNNGSVSTGALQKTTTYSLSCTGSGGTANNSVTVTVAAAPVNTTAYTCTKTLSPGGDVQSFINSLSSGQTGCLRAGTYTAGDVAFTNPGITLASYPGERATINLIYAHVDATAVGTTIKRLNLATTTNTSLIRIFGSNSILEANDLTDNHATGAGACIGVGGSNGKPTNTIIRMNKIHDCGDNTTNLNHGIYAQTFTDLLIANNLFWNNGGYSVQLYPDGTRGTVSHNVIDGSKEYSVRGGVVIDGTTAIDHVVEYNVIANVATAGITVRTGSGHQANNNCFYNNTDGDILGTIAQTGNVNSNPLFTNRTAHDYSLQASSVCLAKVQYDTTSKINEVW